MRIVVLGGTRFIGRAVVSELVGAGHELLIVHRGHHEPDDVEEVEHLHTDRSALARHRDALSSFSPEAVVDLSAMTGRDAEAALQAFGRSRFVVASSGDVYRAFASVWDGSITDPVPLTEQSALRSGPPPDSMVPEGWSFDPRLYDKLDVERAYLGQDAVVCRLPMVYGEYDYKRREDFILGRLRAGRNRIPVGTGSWLWSRAHVGEIARGLRLALESDESGEVFNLAEASCAPIALWMKAIAEAANVEVEFVQVPSEALPEDLEITGDIRQHWLVDSTKARERLGWRHDEPASRVGQSVRWHLDHPPPDSGGDYGEDDRALSGAA